MQIGLEHSYAALPPRFYAQVAPTPVASPRLVLFNRRLAEQLGLQPDLIEPHAAALFSGNQLPQDANPIAMVYAGHQFGGFVPRLGDGRAILLGELPALDGERRDIQLKGSGRTPFSRNGDGRAALAPMLREYIISEAMHALGISTTRALAVVTTGETVLRESAQPGAVLTRVAASHVRVGTFQYFAAQGDRDAVQALLNYVIGRHYPEARDAAAPALAVLSAVAERQLTLITDWMSVGFIHGVMNTDNMTISGETIDYGPCAFMDKYDPNTVFSSIDENGRYSYGNQPAIAQWNIAQFAQTLLPLIAPDAATAVRLATEVLQPLGGQFEQRFLEKMRRKLGLASAADGDAGLIQRLLATMHAAGADFTLTFRRLAAAAAGPAGEQPLRELFTAQAGIDEWLRDWRQRLRFDPQSDLARAASMRCVNPCVIPRNHRVAAALNAACDAGDFAPLHELLEILRCPYTDRPASAPYEAPPLPSEQVFETFCGT